MVTTKINCVVEGSEGFYEGDIMTVEFKIDLTRGAKEAENARDTNEEAPYCAHSAGFPHPKQEIMWVTVECKQEKTAYQYIKLNRKFSTCTKKIMCPILRYGRLEVSVQASFDCYKGLDSKETVVVLAKKEDMRPKEKVVEDPDLNKPSYVEEIVNNITGRKKDDDENVDDDEKTEEKPRATEEKAGRHKKAGKRKTRKVAADKDEDNDE